MAFGFVRKPRVAFLVAATIGCVWLNQGPSLRRYDALVNEASSSNPFLRAWIPFAFAYRRSADEELYFAIGNAIRGAPFDRDLLIAERGVASAAFRRLPPADGHWHAPYAQVPFEYPALALPFILFPALLSSAFAAFAVAFGALMAGLLLVSVHLSIRAGLSSASQERAMGWWLAAALFLAQGGLLIQRLDAVVAVFLSVALWAAVRRRPFLLGLGIALAAAAKIVPLLLLFPMMAADRDAWRLRPAVAKAAAGAAVGLALGFVPMLALSPAGFADFVRYHAARGLNIESTCGAVLSVIGLVSGHPRSATLSFGSYNLDGGAARLCAAASGPTLILAIAMLTAWLARRPSPQTESARARAIACAGLGGLLCIWFFNKVFSPQYLTWGIPFVVATSVRSPAVALVVAMAISQTYLRGFYDYVVEMRALGVVALAIRLFVLIAMAVFVVHALCGHEGRRRTEPAT
jgi:glycosyl transferase family 87